MIRLDRIELLHWDIQPHQMLPLSPGVNLLTGENGAGKTSILDAIKVVLGAPRLEGERSVNGYLLKQARGVAMIRLLLDNRAEPGTRRRPLDALGEYGKDTVTLAVVFHAEDEKEYRREYYILDGDRSPLAPGTKSARALESAAAYRERLNKVGLGNRYLKLLCLPQGQIASLCRHDGVKLFEYLFDIIGGQEVKATWAERLRELGEARRSHDEAQQALEHARVQLVLLSARAKRYEEFLAVEQDLVAVGHARPHARRREPLLRRGRLQKDLEGLETMLDALSEQLKAASQQAKDARLALVGLKDQQAALHKELRQRRQTKEEQVGQYSTLKLRVEQFEALRDEVAAVVPVDPAALRLEADAARQRLAEGLAAAKKRASDVATNERALAQVARGLMPYPDEVEALRDRLRQVGIPHHLLAEVVDIEEKEPFRPAIEAYLGRLRFAILVQDPDSFTEAASIARAMRYPHGVLAPDVRGSSPADEQGLLPLLSIKEPRYQPLLARILRRVMPGEPPRLPAEGETQSGAGRLVPSRHGEHLARDGFVLSRLEARVDSVEDTFLGRGALQQRCEVFRDQRAALQGDEAEWQQAEDDLRTEIANTETAITMQTRRQMWEAARQEYQRLLRERDVAAAAISGLQSGMDEGEERHAAGQTEAERLNRVLGDAENQIETVGEQREAKEDAVRQRREDLGDIERDLAGYLQELLPAPGPPAQQLLADDLSPRTMETMQKDRRERLTSFRSEERDPLLPTNHARQQSEVEAVAARLKQIEAAGKQTQDAAEEAQEQYQQFTRRVFRHYFARLRDAGSALDFAIDGKLAPLPTGDFACEVRVGVGQKAPVHYRSEDLSGGQKAALSILMGMSAVSLESDGPGFFLIDEPFSQSDLSKINELGWFLRRTGSQYLVSMPTSADVEQCGEWLSATWICTKTRGGVDERGRLVLAPPVKLALAAGARDG